MAKYLDYSGLSYLWGKIRAYVGAAKGSNYNLLDNAYFVGGGSQSGSEVFPINSRGKTYYEGVNGEYYFDRWKSDSPWASPIKCGFQNPGVVLAGDVTPSYPDAYAQLTQVISNPPVGKTVTLSILTDNVSSDNEGSPPFLLTNGSVWTPITIGLTKVTFVWASGASSISIILPDGTTSAASLRMQAIKLEIGEFSTIENDSAPDYGVELARCIYSKADPSDTYANNGFGRSNKNLLDNWYFVGGGSQLGDGVFPINQRGTTFYSLSYGNIFDRWHIQGAATSTCTLNANGIAFATDTENCGLSQTIPQGRIVNGETYTLSVMDTAGNIYSGSRVLNTNASWQNFDLGLSAFGWYNPCYVQANGQANVYILDRTGSGGSASIGIAAAKLELGTVSTLANDPPPDYAGELAKCRYYFRRIINKGGSNQWMLTGVCGSTNVGIFVLDEPMRDASATVSYSGSLFVNASAVTSISAYNHAGRTILQFVTGGGLTQYGGAGLVISGGGYFDISRDL